MIELAPRHKFGLSISSPIMPASGFLGYELAVYQPVIRGELFGALVTNPVTLRPYRPSINPQAVEVSGGVIFTTNPINPGVKKTIRQYGKVWRRSTVPVIVHLPADDPADLARTAGALDGLGCVAAFELGLPLNSPPADVFDWVDAILQRSEMPVLARIPFPFDVALIDASIEAGADALVLAANPQGQTFGEDGAVIAGTYFGAGIVAVALPHIAAMKDRYPDVPLIASGGVHTPADVRDYLAAGAVAVQIDSLIFTNPAAAGRILTGYNK